MANTPHTPLYGDIPGGYPSPRPPQSQVNSDAPSDTTYFAPSNSQPAPTGSITPAAPPAQEPTPNSGASDVDTIADDYEPVKPASRSNTRPAPGSNPSDDEIIRVLSRRISHRSGSVHTGSGADEEEGMDIERLLSTIFGQNRQANSEEEKTRHVGVVFRDLTVKGMGLGAALDPTNSDFLMTPLRGLKALVTGRAFHKQPVRTLLHEFTGCVKPKEMLLVLGRPGSGCSTFLKTVANQRSGYEEILGEVTYGGVGAEEMGKNFRGEILYNPEDDLHSATLSVRDTLRFALKTRTPGKESRGEGESRAEYGRNFLKVISKLFWIEHTLGTKVGNAVVRGISGGEKKRVSIAEAMITKASCSCWDNSTRGLDANNATEYVTSLRTLTNMAKISTFVALYQAGENLYELFDKVILIHEGRCAFFGRTEDAKAYFENIGFECRPRWTTADFLTSVTDPHERNVRPGWEDRIPRTAEEFEAAYKSSVFAQKTLQDIEDFEAEYKHHQEARAQETSKATARKNYTIPFHQQVTACTTRQFKVLLGDPFSLYGKWGGLVFQSLIIGSLFYNLSPTVAGVFPKGGIMFFTLLLNALLALSELPAAFDSRPVMLKHKSFSFYRPSAYALAQVVADIPQSAVQVVIWGLIIYFMTGLQRTASQFFIFLLTTFFLTLAMISYFRTIAAFTENLDSATRFTGVSLQAVIVYAGYLIPPDEMKVWFSWIRWINPIQYAFEILMVNEFDGLVMDCVPPFIVPFGPDAEPGHQSCSVRGSQLNNPVVDGADYIESAYGYRRSHLWRNMGIIIAFWIFFVVLTAIGQEYQKPNKGGASITVFKRGQAPQHVTDTLRKKGAGADEEAVHTEKTVELTEGPQGGKVGRNEAVFTFQDITYTIPTKQGSKTLLNSVSGCIQPGRFTALMGESGAGKTTLLNALAQRITFGTVKGTFLIDGKPLPLAFQRATGFAQQDDVHEPTATVREALRFSALLRQPKEVPLQEKYDYVENIINLLEMNDIAGAIVGDMAAGLNQEQRKRVTIGVELASKPELLIFLDEPTSGLDSGAAFNIVRFLRKLADAGQAVLCTIHQPSAVLFECFDDLILLKQGGEMVYHGPLGTDSQTMIQYFERNGAPKCPKNKNPAEYMLSSIGAGDPNHKGQNWGETWLHSPEHRQLAQEISSNIEARRSNSSVALDNREYAMPWRSQTTAVIKRVFVAYWRSPSYAGGIFILHVMTALFNAFTFYNLGNSVIAMQSRMFSLFLTLTIAPPLMQQLQPKFLAFRDIFTARESASKIYHWTSLVIANILVEIPYRFVAGTLYFIAWFYPVGFPRDSATAAYVWALFMLFQLYYTSFAHAIAAMVPNALLASILVPTFFLFVVSFCGVVVPYASMIPFWRSWMYWLSPFTYVLEGMLGVLTHRVPVQCQTAEFARFTPPDGVSCDAYASGYLEQAGGYVQTGMDGVCELCQYSDGGEFSKSFHISYTHRWRDFGIFAAFIAFNMVWIFVASWVYLGGVKRLKARWGKKKTV